MGKEPDSAGGVPNDHISIERRTLAIEEEKLRVQKRQVPIQVLAAALPLLILAWTISDASRRLEREAHIQFELEAAKAIMQAESPAAAVGRARFYERAFPGRVPPNLADRIDLRPYTSDRLSRMEFIKTVAASGLNARQTAELWVAIFPGDQFPRSPQVRAMLSRVRTAGAE